MFSAYPSVFSELRLYVESHAKTRFRKNLCLATRTRGPLRRRVGLGLHDLPAELPVVARLLGPGGVLLVALVAREQRRAVEHHRRVALPRVFPPAELALVL